ncbi:MAG: hypothetical protein RMZ41_020565 [Nostoc sp. DedVER02]|uniref:hypothetical protein n=1 Tax=unclassified Nostoc TaxID=2593658 RepID=UPI002AD3B0CD|nr:MULTISPECIES: hypothetical protein [unclassified Nostoc]MDZ7984901.1 hypothetical protein [Nostoc sp. DedVER02]MDZ8111089.1 hypothetical protein [Nostoc sp. DedVER01b]
MTGLTQKIAQTFIESGGKSPSRKWQFSMPHAQKLHPQGDGVFHFLVEAIHELPLPLVALSKP